MRAVAKKPVLKHLVFNAARPGVAGESCSCFASALFIAVHRHGVKQVISIKVGIKVPLRQYDAFRVFVPKHFDDQLSGFGVQIMWTITLVMLWMGLMWMHPYTEDTLVSR